MSPARTTVGRRAGKRPFWFAHTREARRVLSRAADLRFPTHRASSPR